MVEKVVCTYRRQPEPRDWDLKGSEGFQSSGSKNIEDLHGDYEKQSAYSIIEVCGANQKHNAMQQQNQLEIILSTYML